MFPFLHPEHTTHHKRNVFKSDGKEIKKSSHSSKNTFKSAGKKFEGAVHQVYHDGKKAVGTVGKHALKDVDNISSTLSNPLIWIAVGGVAIVFLINR